MLAREVLESLMFEIFKISGNHPSGTTQLWLTLLLDSRIGLMTLHSAFKPEFSAVWFGV